jgi:hypothetical protein
MNYLPVGTQEIGFNPDIYLYIVKYIGVIAAYI